MYNSEQNPRNVRGDTRNIRKSARPLAYTITHRELLAKSAQAFREFAGEGSGAATKVAEALDCSKATAKNYLDGRNVPAGVHDLRALHAVPTYAAMKREIAAMERTIDPRLQAKLVELARFVQLHGDVVFDGPETKS